MGRNMTSDLPLYAGLIWVCFLNAGVKGIEGSEEIYLHRIIDAVMMRVMPEEEQQSTGIVDFDLDAHVQAV
jgi:lipopolysaccharide transport system ATP-binding protein